MNTNGTMKTENNGTTQVIFYPNMHMSWGQGVRVTTREMWFGITANDSC